MLYGKCPLTNGFVNAVPALHESLSPAEQGLRGQGQTARADQGRQRVVSEAMADRAGGAGGVGSVVGTHAHTQTLLKLPTLLQMSLAAQNAKNKDAANEAAAKNEAGARDSKRAKTRGSSAAEEVI